MNNSFEKIAGKINIDKVPFFKNSETGVNKPNGR